MVVKAQAAAVAYNAIYGNMGEFVSYEDKMKFVIDVINILQTMADTEYKQYIDSKPKMNQRTLIKVKNESREHGLL